MFRIPILAIVAALLAPLSAIAQHRPVAEPTPARPVEIPADGTELFRALLDRAGVKPIKEQDVWNLHEMWNLHGSRDYIVIVLGSTHHGRHGNGIDFVQQVLKNGGAALIATDTSLNLDRFVWGQQRAEVAPARIRCKNPDLVHNVIQPDGSLQPQWECPYVIPMASLKEHRNEFRNPLTHIFSGDGMEIKPLTRVATNNSSYIFVDQFQGEIRQPLAKFPKRCLAVRTDQFRFVEPERIDDALFAVGGYGPNGVDDRTYRFIAMADHSVFINQMLIEPGTENLELTYRVIDYLQGPEKRKKCLFIENGRVIDRFDGLRQAFAKPKPQMPMPNPKAVQDKVVDMGNRLIDHFETNNMLNRGLLQIFKLPSIARFFLLLLMVYATWFLLKRMFSSRKPTDIPPSPMVAGVPSGPPGVFDRRQKELIRRNNIYEPVRDMVREFFATVGVHGEPGPKCPKVVISRAVRKPESLRLAVKDFWALAFGPPQEMTVNRWRELSVYLDRVRVAHAERKWHFADVPAPALGS
ncbi:MAG: hypothetical protein K8U57_22590 [Planctomycetes bacterium]|nr:hypothetical protein [Planctomycetota bacterium]